MARYSEAQNKATQKYVANNYDEIKVRVPKGKREEYKAHASSKGKSLNQAIIDLIEEDMLMNANKLMAAAKLYDKMDMYTTYNLTDLAEAVARDVDNDYLTENVARNGSVVLWYVDEIGHNEAIYIDTLEFLSEDEIDRELC